MAEKSHPWTANGTGDGTTGGYTGLEWGEMWRRLFNRGNEASAGVVRGHGNDLAVSGTATPLSVATGAAQVYGKHYYNDAALTLSVTTPVVGTTGGHVILELDWTAQTVRAKVVRNTDGVNSTPALTQSTSTVWQVRLATFTITTGGAITVTDARKFLGPHWDAANGKLTAEGNTGGQAQIVAKSGAGATARIDLQNSARIWSLIAGVVTATDTLFGIFDATAGATRLQIDSAGDVTVAGALTAGDLAATDDLTVGDDATVGGDLAVTGNITRGGSSVPNVYRRQGGSASDWSSPGTTGYTPTAGVRMQIGVVASGTVGPSGDATVAITFPVAFSQPPLIVCSVQNPTNQDLMVCADDVTASGFNLKARNRNSVASQSGDLVWFATGPE